MENKIYRFLITLVCLVFVFRANSQALKPVGKWKMTKHMAKIEGDKDYNCNKYNSQFLLINANGTFQIKIVDAPGKMSWFTYGKWSMSCDNKEITFTVTDWEPKNNSHQHNDKTCEIVKLSKTEFIFKEYMCTKDVIGTSYFVPHHAD